jgi:hypothetical protein
MLELTLTVSELPSKNGRSALDRSPEVSKDYHFVCLSLQFGRAPRLAIQPKPKGSFPPKAQAGSADRECEQMHDYRAVVNVPLNGARPATRSVASVGRFGVIGRRKIHA